MLTFNNTMTTPGNQLKKKPVILFLFGVAAILKLGYDEIASPLLYRTLRGETGYNSDVLFIPPSLDADRQRLLSLDLGSGRCLWQPPKYDVPENIDFHKTIVTGYPSEDKRMVFAQMEALTGWPAKDEWDFVFNGLSNHPFIKANYPHHEGIWSWDSVADQVVMMIRNIRGAMIEYHDIVWDINYADSFVTRAQVLADKELYEETPTVKDFLTWRDKRVLDEVHWYGWFIDYWMEGGLMRDVITHKITTPEHWNMLRDSSNYTHEERQYDVVVGPDTVVTASYDPHCINGDVSGGCEPVAVFSAQRLRNYNSGAAETGLIAQVLINDARTGKYVISERNWNCIWRELIVKRKGPKTGRRGGPGADTGRRVGGVGRGERDLREYKDYPEMNWRKRPQGSGEVAFGGAEEGDEENEGVASGGVEEEEEGLYEDDYNFSADMIGAMIEQLTRLIDKYGSRAWDDKPTARRIVDLLVDHRASIRIEFVEVNAGVRQLTDEDFLGPKERQRRMLLKLNQNNENELNALEGEMDHSGYFKAIEQKLKETKAGIRKANAVEVENKAANAVAVVNK